MIEKLQDIEKRYEQLQEELIKLKTEKEENRFREYKKILSNIEGNEEIIQEDSDQELKELAEAELEDLFQNRDDLEQKLKMMLIPKDPMDEKNIIMEIQPVFRWMSLIRFV